MALRYFRFQEKLLLAFGKHFGKFTAVKVVSMHGISYNLKLES